MTDEFKVSRLACYVEASEGRTISIRAWVPTSGSRKRNITSNVLRIERSTDPERVLHFPNAGQFKEGMQGYPTRQPLPLKTRLGWRIKDRDQIKHTETEDMAD